MIYISKNDIRANECVTNLPAHILDTYTVAYESTCGELGFFKCKESTEILNKIIVPKSFSWSDRNKEPTEFLGDFKEKMSFGTNGRGVVFHETNDNFTRELKIYRDAGLKKLKENLKGGCSEVDQGVLWRMVKKDPGFIHLGELDIVSAMCRFFSVWSCSDAGIYFHLYEFPKFINENLDIQFVDELPWE
ncbi:hypothetical protein [Rheinheimera sp.]|uniref:hypothetical protein n=1 Tax=Rheinheimera sp. TaxID=1869214 RepID=UPI003D2C5854